jgi:hypothetical protein
MSWVGDLLRAGIESDGRNVAIPSGTISARNLVTNHGSVWYVNSAVTRSGNGKNWGRAFKTITEAVGVASAGDTIVCKGSFNEAVECSKAGISFVGGGTGPSQAVWTAPTVADSFCLKLSAEACIVTGFRFRPVIYTTSGVPSGICLSGADYSRIIGNRFQGQPGSYVAIYSPECDSDNVEILDNEFIYMNTAEHGAAILGVGASYSAWKIRRNSFNSCVTAIKLTGRVVEITDNIFHEHGLSAGGAIEAVMTLGIDLSDTGGGGNYVARNFLGGTYDTRLYVEGASGDAWGQNYGVDGLASGNPPQYIG